MWCSVLERDTSSPLFSGSHPKMTEKLLTGMKSLNQTNKQKHFYDHFLSSTPNYSISTDIRNYSIYTQHCIKEYVHRDYMFHIRRKELERLTFCNKFYKNQWIGFVHMAMCKFLNNCLWRPQFCKTWHVTKIKNTTLQDLVKILHLKAFNINYVV